MRKNFQPTGYTPRKSAILGSAFLVLALWGCEQQNAALPGMADKEKTPGIKPARNRSKNTETRKG